eukprot:2830544-Rhodomonas_salina.1
MFVDGEVGHPGRQSDSAISKFSWMFQQIRDNPDLWLGEDGLVIGYGGFAQVTGPSLHLACCHAASNTAALHRQTSS